ncbi:NADH-cytochrome b5 reductase [Chytridiales sp. JEL 0842]|nr:NADH-cytochrome b5 reductase [Chytridiales sp. JEL 0842]
MEMENPLVVGAVASLIIFVGAIVYFTQSGKPKTALASGDWIFVDLIKKTEISPNTAIYRFKLPNAKQPLGLPIGQHIQVTTEISGKQVTRSYTPISSDDDLGFCDLLVKSYPTGNISKYFGELKLGDKIKIRGPKGNFVYQPNMVPEIGMIAGGTGITPMLQVIRAILKNPQDKTQIRLIFANVTKDDILLREELDELEKKHSQLKVYYVLNTPPEGWNGGVGFVTKDMIAAHLPKFGGSKILLCGPPPMIQVMVKYCEELGFPKAQVISKAHDIVFKF